MKILALTISVFVTVITLTSFANADIIDDRTERTCLEGVCKLNIFNSPQRVLIDNEWKKVINATHKNESGVSLLFTQVDPDFFIDVESFAPEQITFLIGFNGSPEYYPDECDVKSLTLSNEDFKCQFKLQFKELGYDIKIDYKYEMKDGVVTANNNKFSYNGNANGKTFKLGGQSTEVTVYADNNETDGHIYYLNDIDDGASSGYSADPTLSALYSGIWYRDLQGGWVYSYRSFWSFNTSYIPDSATVLNATVVLDGVSRGAADSLIGIYRSDDVGSAITTDDYDKCNQTWESTAYGVEGSSGNNMTNTPGYLINSSYYNGDNGDHEIYGLNPSNVNKTGQTTYCIKHDPNDWDYSSMSLGDDNRIRHWASERNVAVDIPYMIVYYETGVGCTENWTCSNSTCSEAIPTYDNITTTCSDANECGTYDDLPAENGTIYGCDYCEYDNINSSWSDWFNMTDCIDNITQQNRSRVEFDTNYSTCYGVTNLSTDYFANYTHWDYQNVSCTSPTCTPNWVGINVTPWNEGTPVVGDWVNVTACNSTNETLQSRDTEYWNYTTQWYNDTNSCGESPPANITVYQNETTTDYQIINCTYTEPPPAGWSPGASFMLFKDLVLDRIVKAVILFIESLSVQKDVEIGGCLKYNCSQPSGCVTLGECSS